MIDLYNGDCLKIMDELIAKGVKVDAIITDPPYGMSFQSNHRTEKYKAIENDDSLEWLGMFFDKAKVMLNENSHIYCFCSWHKIDIFKVEFEKRFDLKNLIVWEKNNTGMGDLFGAYAPKHELCLFGGIGNRKLNGNREPDIVKAKRTGNEFHPTQKPIDLIQKFVRKSTDEGEVVFDPFMGSGTTGIAAAELKRSFIGVEIDEQYFKVAKKRIVEDGTQQRLFI